MTTPPILLILDFQEIHRAEGHPLAAPMIQRAIAATGNLIGQARQAGQRILFSHRQYETDRFNGLIDGVRPHPRDEIFPRFGLSAFSNPYLLESLVGTKSDILLATPYLSGSGLATITNALDFDLKIKPITAACTSPHIGGVPVSQIERHIQGLLALRVPKRPLKRGFETHRGGLHL